MNHYTQEYFYDFRHGIYAGLNEYLESADNPELRYLVTQKKIMHKQYLVTKNEKDYKLQTDLNRVDDWCRNIFI